MFPRKYKIIVEKYSAFYGVDENLVYAVIKTESSFDVKAVSEKGAVGLMQIIPPTAEYISEKWFGGEEYDLFDPETNVKYGVKYLSCLIEKFNGVREGLAAYNAGEGNVGIWLDNRKYSEDGTKLDVIPFAETENYIKNILRRRKIYDVLY